MGKRSYLYRWTSVEGLLKSLETFFKNSRILRLFLMNAKIWALKDILEPINTSRSLIKSTLPDTCCITDKWIEEFVALWQKTSDCTYCYYTVYIHTYIELYLETVCEGPAHKFFNFLLKCNGITWTPYNKMKPCIVCI